MSAELPESPSRSNPHSGSRRTLVLWLFGLLATPLALGMVCAKAVTGFWSDPPRTLDAPLRAGMTIAEVGRARPTEYELEFPEIDEATAAKRNMTRFSGWMWVTDPSGDEVDIRFENGKCSDDRSPANASRTVYDLTPVGTTVAQALRKLGPRYKLVFRPESLTYDLPTDAPRLKGFTGTLTGYESTGWTFYHWHVAFRRGIVRSVNETVDYD